ncbi:multicopper oxidase domain-containing protein [Caballeronia sp. LZ024]|uniref:multicopper oxidase domain-containing protein n=1 Tax=Caballeronia sp. LZ024 TaxID=3038561 RepID=UPI0038D4BE67
MYPSDAHGLRNFTGEFAMHCHILDHEDRNMMENVAVVSPTIAWLQRLSARITAMTKGTSRWKARCAARVKRDSRLLLRCVQPKATHGGRDGLGIRGEGHVDGIGKTRCGQLDAR